MILLNRLDVRVLAARPSKLMTISSIFLLGGSCIWCVWRMRDIDYRAAGWCKWA